MSLHAPRISPNSTPGNPPALTGFADLPTRKRRSYLSWMPLRILLADDCLSVRQGVKTLLERDGFEVVAEAADGREAVRLAQAHRPDVAVLDLAMPQLNGLDTAHEILQVCPGTRAILLTIHTEEYQILMALRRGIRGYIVKTHAAEELAQAIREVAGGRIYLSPSVFQVVVEAYLANIKPPIP